MIRTDTMYTVMLYHDMTLLLPRIRVVSSCELRGEAGILRLWICFTPISQAQGVHCGHRHRGNLRME
jgi:hypothetical protein